jgi:WS/DGAT/MGAT family acyltransferase
LTGGQRARIERASADDLMMIATDTGPVPMQVGAVLTLEAGAELDLAAATAMLAERITAVPRLRQRLVRAPLGCGRPVWVDDQAFDIGAHVRAVTCKPPGDEAALLEVAVSLVTEPLPWTRPLWSAALIPGLAGSRSAVVVVFHHVLADGIGGLAVLASLVDGGQGPEPVPFPRPAPGRRELAAEALRSRLSAFAPRLASLRKLPSALAELNPGGALRPARSTLNRVTGPGRRAAVARADLSLVRATARAHEATVNDVVLAAAARALHTYLASRHERLDSLVASVMISGRASTGPATLGNVVGVMPVRLPAWGEPGDQLRQIAVITRAHKARIRGASAGLLRPAFRGLAALGMFGWFVNHQRLVNVFVTNLRGPDQAQTFAGAVITEVIPITIVTGNVTLSFAVLSYAGSVAVAVVADLDAHPDLAMLAAMLQAELDGLISAVRAGPRMPGCGSSGPGS